MSWSLSKVTIIIYTWKYFSGFEIHFSWKRVILLQRYCTHSSKLYCQKWGSSGTLMVTTWRHHVQRWGMTLNGWIFTRFRSSCFSMFFQTISDRLGTAAFLMATKRCITYLYMELINSQSYEDVAIPLREAPSLQNGWIFRKFILQIFAIKNGISVMNSGKKLQYDFPKRGGGESKAVWNFSENSSDLEMRGSPYWQMYSLELLA